ncbi:DUF447 family protein [Methylocystis sp. H4A]|uniref:DUF447 domain-containing protein n=1 Tax=Methylocystis sp. H4A TaxID=2785788 RepID=UPI0018C2E5DE|nr:DUF447 domain-containing protein [Methylocystis sp. H4A]MBG0802183.1 DUF447 family protein [Methylocystis sp. H4A]
MPLIHECVVTTLSPEGRPHIAPLGLIEEHGFWIAAPFRPSSTLFNLTHNPKATASFTDDARIFAGLVAGQRNWPLTDIEDWPAPRLSAALAHAELIVARVEEHESRPRFFCRVRRIESHRAFLGMNRARAAVLEAAILATRLDMLPREKIESELAYLQIAIDKTAGEAEREAWNMVMEKIDAHKERAEKRASR